ncbi:MAG TPA: alpha/beta fold hydrolase [Bacteroidia bacterium]|nr:alpha/beta fold hydrolase [Bacteroidia bacterium]
MELFFRKYGESGKKLMILHGLFGMSDNWHQVSQLLDDTNIVYNTELRNHGQSPHSHEMNYSLMADDIAETLDSLSLDKINILGHSMGGKAVMTFALNYPERVEKLVVADIGIKAYRRGHDEIFDAIIPLKLSEYATRGEIDKHLTPLLPEFTTRQFILKNLARNEKGEFYWKMNVTDIFKNYDNIIAPVDSSKTFTGPTLFIRGENSNYIKDEDWDGIKKIFPNANLETIPGAGHWVHADQPTELVNTVKEFINS